MIDLLLLALLLGLAAAALASTVRALAPVMWLFVKPWSCDLCMSAHCANLLALVWWGGHLHFKASAASTVRLGLVAMAAQMVSMFALKAYARLAP